MTNSGDDDDWEYEYHDQETEDFYISIDFTDMPDRGDSTNASYYLVRDIGGRRSVYIHKRIIEHDVINSKANAAVGQGEAMEETVEAFGELQLLNLHTENPIATYNGQLLSLRWSSPLGTDLLFVQRPTTHEVKPVRSLPSVDLLGFASAKLIASAATLQPADHILSNTPVAQDTVVTRSQTPGERSDMNEERSHKEGSFLARLNLAKTRRGEKARLMHRQEAQNPAATVYQPESSFNSESLERPLKESSNQKRIIDSVGPHVTQDMAQSTSGDIAGMTRGRNSTDNTFAIRWSNEGQSGEGNQGESEEGEYDEVSEESEDYEDHYIYDEDIDWEGENYDEELDGEGEIDGGL